MYVYLPEEGKALTDEDKNPFTSSIGGYKYYCQLLNAFKNIKGDDVNELLKSI